jgi:N-acetylneuraminic acid mutarotase
MIYARALHTSTLLTNGKVLVTGGVNNDTHYHSTTELYDLSTQTWTMTGSMNYARAEHTATVLTDGKVLITGGYDAKHEFSTIRPHGFHIIEWKSVSCWWN